MIIALAVLYVPNSLLWSAISSNAYQQILDRNVFGLKPRPDLEVSQVQSNRPASKIFLTGLTSILGDARALIKIPPRPGNAGDPPAKEQCYILKKGERADDIEIIDIDVKAMRVKISDGGTIEELSFERNGVNLIGSPAPPPPPGMLRRPSGFAQR